MEPVSGGESGSRAQQSSTLQGGSKGGQGLHFGAVFGPLMFLFEQPKLPLKN